MKWQNTTLGAVLSSAEIFTDGDWVESKDQDPSGDVRLIQLADIGDGSYIDRSSRFLTPSKARELKCTFLEAGDVLVARMPDPLGRACIFPGESRPSVTVVDVCVIRTRGSDVDPRWLVHWLNSPSTRTQISTFATGTTRSRISRGNLGNLMITLPPLAEQRRIARILDKVDTLRAKRREALAELDTLAQSIFLDMFGDPVMNPRSWPLKTLGSIGTVERGVSKHRPRGAPELLGGPYPLIQTGDVANCDGYVRTFASTYSEIGLRQSRIWPTGTLCITIAANIAKTGILTFDACFPDSVAGFRCDEAATVMFIRSYFSFVQASIERVAPESAQKNINLEILRGLPVLNPPLELQRHFARRLAAVETVRTKGQTSLTECDALFASLRHRAFRGEL